jgi:hypothetical protein
LDIFIYTLILISFFSILHILTAGKNKSFPVFIIGLGVILSVFVIYQLQSSPALAGNDKFNYLRLFQNISLGQALESKDIGFGYYVYLCRSLFSDESLFFTLTALLYILGYWIFALKTFGNKYVFVFLLMVFVSFGFIAYGINTIRAGIALSMFMIAISYHKNTLVFILFGILSVLFHKSLAIPFLFFILSHYFNHPKLFLKIWILALVLSFLNISVITSFLQNVFSFDDRSGIYFDTENSLRYKTGFRIDFVIYSSIPIAVSYYYIFKLKLKDKLYSQLFNTYLLTNAVWLLVIRMAFTDRVAYLSWFLIPFLVLYPLLKYKLPINQRKWVASILFVALSFTTFMYFK